MWSRTKKLFASSCVAAAALAASGVAQANLVANGGFETGDFSGWTHTVPGGFDFDGVGDSTVLNVQAGTYAAFLGDAPSSLSQTLATVAGAKYVLSFWLAAEDFLGLGLPSTNAFSANVGGAEVMSLSNASPTGYNLYEIGFIATGASTNLTLTFSQDVSYWDLDSVNVTLPEPGSLALLAAAGLGGVVASRRRKSASTSA